ncbi:MAG: pyridoxamine 5'-phosphate oxidase family protein [Pseudomonadota bacterium]
MSKRFPDQEDINEFLATTRIAMLLYNGPRPSPTGVPVWFDWDGTTLQMFASRTSPKVAHLQADPNVSVLVTNHVGEPEGWVSFDGTVQLSEFDPTHWSALLDRIAPRYWDLSIEAYAREIENWRSAPQAMISLSFVPDRIRSGA